MIRLRLLFVAVVMLSATTLRSYQLYVPAKGTAEGYWSGAVEVPNEPFKINVWINRNPQGAWGGTMDIPSQSVVDYPLIVTGEGRSITFRVPSADGNPIFKATLSEDTNKLSGEVTKGGAPLRFELTRQQGPPLPVSSSGSDDHTLAHARRLLDLLQQQKFEDVVKDFDPQMTAALPVNTLSQTWTTIRAQAGEFKSELSQKVNQVGPLTIVTLGCQFERAALNMVVVFGADEKISGLNFVPRPPAAANAGSPAPSK